MSEGGTGPFALERKQIEANRNAKSSTEATSSGRCRRCFGWGKRWLGSFFFIFYFGIFDTSPQKELEIKVKTNVAEHSHHDHLMAGVKPSESPSPIFDSEKVRSSDWLKFFFYFFVVVNANPSVCVL